MAVHFEPESDRNLERQMSQEFNAKFGRPETRLSYQVVGRLSRWEGGDDRFPSQGLTTSQTVGPEMIKPESMTILQFLKQFIRPTYDLTEVTVEDIERVKIMHDRFVGDAQFNFNYTTLLVIASVIAGVGLGVNSAASIIASMLVSPLMGPVTAIAYGITIGDYKLVRMGFVTEIVSLAICIIIGVIVAGCFLPLKDATDDWPEEEMLGRGEMRNFYAGIPIAFFSGLGVAVGLLDSQTNSLVGVAISASLLPPAVNAGMLWVVHFAMDDQYLDEGMRSLFLTIMNIGAIIVASMLMFRLKETLPIEKSIFWSDLGVARKIYNNVAIIPKFQEEPSDSIIEQRVARFFPRCSEMKRTDPTLLQKSRNLIGEKNYELDRTDDTEVSNDLNGHDQPLSPITE